MRLGRGRLGLQAKPPRLDDLQLRLHPRGVAGCLGGRLLGAQRVGLCRGPLLLGSATRSFRLRCGRQCPLGLGFGGESLVARGLGRDGGLVVLELQHLRLLLRGLGLHLRAHGGCLRLLHALVHGVRGLLDLRLGGKARGLRFGQPALLLQLLGGLHGRLGLRDGSLSLGLGGGAHGFPSSHLRLGDQLLLLRLFRNLSGLPWTARAWRVRRLAAAQIHNAHAWGARTASAIY